MRSKQSYTFEHEGVQTAPTKIPKFEVKYSKKQKPVQTGTSTQTQTGEGYILGEAPANVYTVSTYSPLTQQIDLPPSDGLPSLISASSSYQTASPDSSYQIASPGSVAYTPLPYSPYSNASSPTNSSPDLSSPGTQALWEQLSKGLANYLSSASPKSVTPTNVWNGEGMNMNFPRPSYLPEGPIVFRRPPPIETQNLSPRTRPPSGFYYESPV